VEADRVDFVSFLTQDILRAKAFYAETLGLGIEGESEDDMEFRLGQVTLDIFNPASIGHPFAPNLGGLAIRVPDAARAELEAKGVTFDGETIDSGVCSHGDFPRPRRKRPDTPPTLRPLP
jgi:catechol 2,3-dioxygenase-like lactoylglutathione lyase family enzyme